MPSGPSHSHSGGGSSHSSSGGGFSRGGFSGGGSFNHTRRPWRWHFGGRTVIISTGRQNTFLAVLGALFLFVVATVCCFMACSGIKETVKKQETKIAVFEQDAEWYKNVIEKAKDGKDGYYITKAEFSPFEVLFYNESNPQTGYYEYGLVNGIHYFYILYEYTNEKTGDVTKAETYAQFTSSQASGWNGEIAYAYSEEDSAWFSINTNYSLERNMEYVETKQLLKSNKNSVKSTRTGGIVCAIVAVGMVVVCVFVTKNIIKKAKAEAEAEQAKQEAEIAEANRKAEESKAKAEKINRVCSYCGCKISDDADQCPSCGSRVFKK